MDGGALIRFVLCVKVSNVRDHHNAVARGDAK
jgi:hypothetical protein